MELKGKVEFKLDVETGTSKAGKEWQKQTLVINNGDQYSPNQAISFFGDTKVELLAAINIGDDVVVAVNLSSKEYNGKWYNQIDGWKVTGGGGATAPAPAVDDAPEEEDDLPF